MSGRYDAHIGDDVILDAVFTLAGSPHDVEIDHVELVNDSLSTIATIPGAQVVRISTGHYRVTFAAVPESGQLCDHWLYYPVPGSALETLVLSVFVTPVEGASPEVAPEDPTVPDIGLEHVCKVTHRFLNASGFAQKGVYVRFRPIIHTEDATPQGTIAHDSDSVSDDNGNFVMYLVRNTRGTLAIAGVGLVREVTVPDVGNCDLYDLVASTQDLFEVQNLDDFINLPRDS